MADRDDLGRRPGPSGALSARALAILAEAARPVSGGRGGGAPADLAALQAQRAAQERERRPRIDAWQARLGVRDSRRTADGVPVVQLEPAQADHRPDGWVLYVHGGGFTGGLAHDMTAVLLTALLRRTVVSVDYALSPEVAFPVALDQVVAAWRAEQAARGRGVVVGVSAGGNLALGLLQRLHAARHELPAAVGLSSPWSDLAEAGDTRSSNDGRDPVLDAPGHLALAAGAYAQGAALTDPLVSPVRASWGSWLPPTVVVSGTRDLLLSDCARLTATMRADGAPRVELHVHEGMWHAFTGQPDLPEAEIARTQMAAVLESGLAR